MAEPGSGHVLVATGVKREAATLKQPGLVVISGGGDAAGLRAKLERAVDGARGVLSFGMGGALADGLKIGDWVVGERLVGTVQAACDPAWAAVLLGQLPGARPGSVYADGRLVADAADKLALGERHKALAVDMESHIAAAVAVERGLPFAIARCISDEARHAMPRAITVAMRSDGGVDGLAMLRSLVGRPSQCAAFAATIGGFLHAMAALKRGAARIRTEAGDAP